MRGVFGPRTDPWGLLQSPACVLHAHRFKEAAKEASAVLELTPGSAAALKTRAKAYEAQGLLKQALADVQVTGRMWGGARGDLPSSGSASSLAAATVVDLMGLGCEVAMDAWPGSQQRLHELHAWPCPAADHRVHSMQHTTTPDHAHRSMLHPLCCSGPEPHRCFG